MSHKENTYTATIGPCHFSIDREEGIKTKLIFDETYGANIYEIIIDEAQNCCEDFNIEFNGIAPFTDDREIQSTGALNVELTEDDYGCDSCLNIITIKFCSNDCYFTIEISNCHNGYYPHFVEINTLTRQTVFEKYV